MKDLDTSLDLMELGELDFIICEADHKRPFDLPCTHEATHRVTMLCRPEAQGVVCPAIVQANWRYISADRLCGTCVKLASECWSMTKL